MGVARATSWPRMSIARSLMGQGGFFLLFRKVDYKRKVQSRIIEAGTNTATMEGTIHDG